MNMNIYITTRNKENLKKVPNKSGLINKLLNTFFSEPDFHLDVKAGQTNVATKIIKTPKDAQEAVGEYPGYISKELSARRKK